MFSLSLLHSFYDWVTVVAAVASVVVAFVVLLAVAVVLVSVFVGEGLDFQQL